MEQRPLVSVVVPVYKTPERFLRICIESMQNQTVKNSQIILIDDGSPDYCGAVCDEYAAQDSRILVLHKENGGVSTARNLGLEHVKGKYLTFADSDDSLAPETWEKAIQAMEETRADCAVFGWINNESGAPQPRMVAEQKKTLTALEAMAQIAGDNDACGGGYPWNKMWNIDSIRANNGGIIPGFDRELFTYEDKYWILQLLNGLGNVVLIPEVFYDYRFVESSLTNNDESWYRRQFNAYVAYDKICDFLQPIDQNAYRAGIGKYFRFCFTDMKNMYSWRKQDLPRYARTKKCLLKVCKRIKPGDLRGMKYNFAWIACLIYCRF